MFNINCAALDGNIGKVEKLAMEETLNMDQKESDMVKTTHSDDDKKQIDVCADSSVGDKLQSVHVGVNENTTMIAVKGKHTMLASELLS